jgi:HEPN domain-containing protein
MSSADPRRRRIAPFGNLAGEEMKAAEILLDTLPRQCAFFQQQSAEKLVRAVHEVDVEGIPAGPTHNLRTLTDLLGGAHPLRPHLREVEELSSAATRFRYPGGFGDAARVGAEKLKMRQVRITTLRNLVDAFVARARTDDAP